jgi:hypothetical protein
MAQMKRKRWYTDSVRLIRKERNSLVTAQFIYWLDDWTTGRLDDWTTGGTTGDGRLGTDEKYPNVQEFASVYYWVTFNLSLSSCP